MNQVKLNKKKIQTMIWTNRRKNNAEMIIKTNVLKHYKMTIKMYQIIFSKNEIFLTFDYDHRFHE